MAPQRFADKRTSKLDKQIAAARGFDSCQSDLNNALDVLEQNVLDTGTGKRSGREKRKDTIAAVEALRLISGQFRQTVKAIAPNVASFASVNRRLQRAELQREVIAGGDPAILAQERSGMKRVHQMIAQEKEIDLDGSSSDKGPRITHIESYQEKNVHSIFKGSGDSQSSPKNVQRVKNSWIFNAAGQMAEPMFTLTGLSESELPRDTCCFAEGPMETAWKKLVIDTCATKASTAS